MSFYVPTFRDTAKAQFQQLDPQLQEAVLDAVDEMLAAALPPAVARRMTQPVTEAYDVAVTASGRDWHLFVQAELDPDHRLLRVLTIAAVPV